MISGLIAHLWQSTLCAGVAWLLALVLRSHQARIRYWVWFIASAKFLMPFSLLVGFGAIVPWRAASSASETEWVAVADHVRPLVAIPALGAEVAVAANSANWGYAAAALVLVVLRICRDRGLLGGSMEAHCGISHAGYAVERLRRDEVRRTNTVGAWTYRTWSFWCFSAGFASSSRHCGPARSAAT